MCTTYIVIISDIHHDDGTANHTQSRFEVGSMQGSRNIVDPHNYTHMGINHDMVIK